VIIEITMQLANFVVFVSLFNIVRTWPQLVKLPGIHPHSSVFLNPIRISLEERSSCKKKYIFPGVVTILFLIDNFFYSYAFIFN
jgi:hypothetical protein